jgi:magnesium-transporting ATPase (P-type)
MKTLLMISNMELPPVEMTYFFLIPYSLLNSVYRDRKWIKISSDKLVPGDIC